MTFHVNLLSRCSASGIHYPLEVVIGAQTHVIEMTKDDMELDFATKDDAKEAIIARVRSAVKEANATTFAQAKVALEGKDFKL